MNKQSHDHQHHDHDHQHHKPKRGLHRDWRLWAAVVLMLACIGIYLMTMDESLRPGGNGQRQPAAAP